MIKTVFQSDGA